jgi:hypothetical protein
MEFDISNTRNLPKDILVYFLSQKNISKFKMNNCFMKIPKMLELFSSYQNQGGVIKYLEMKNQGIMKLDMNLTEVLSRVSFINLSTLNDNYEITFSTILEISRIYKKRQKGQVILENAISNEIIEALYEQKSSTQLILTNLQNPFDLQVISAFLVYNSFINAHSALKKEELFKQNQESILDFQEFMNMDFSKLRFQIEIEWKMKVLNKSFESWPAIRTFILKERLTNKENAGLLAKSLKVCSELRSLSIHAMYETREFASFLSGNQSLIKLNLKTKSFSEGNSLLLKESIIKNANLKVLRLISPLRNMEVAPLIILGEGIRENTNLQVINVCSREYTKNGLNKIRDQLSSKENVQKFLNLEFY